MRQASTCACTFERVANEVDNNVSVIDTATNTVVATVPMGRHITGRNPVRVQNNYRNYLISKRYIRGLV
jgi:DNA-binding beta-propeller fold protein YncE